MKIVDFINTGTLFERWSSCLEVGGG